MAKYVHVTRIRIEMFEVRDAKPPGFKGVIQVKINDFHRHGLSLFLSSFLLLLVVVVVVNLM